MSNITRPTRAQLQAFIPDQRAVLAFEALFDSMILEPGDIVYTGGLTRRGALAANGAAISRTLYADLLAALVRVAVVTMTIASPCVVTWAAHALPANTPIVPATTGALPTGLVAGTTYFVKSPAANTFNVSATAGGAAINTSGSQSGVHTITAYPFGIGDGTTTFNLPTVASVGGCGAFIIY